MNIHIDKEKFETLINSKIIGEFEIGSSLYNLNDEKSDKDFLIIYHPFENQLYNPFTNRHQYQYKDIENNIDYNFVDINTFIINLFSGDSIINYELIHSEQIKNTKISFLYDIRNDIKSYDIIKSFLGFADRDCRLINKRKSEHDKIRGVVHAYRSYVFAKNIFYDKFSLIDEDVISFKNTYKDFRSKTTRELRQIIKNFRHDVLNKAIENNEITRYCTLENQKYITDNLFKLTDIINEGYLNIDDIYQSNEKEIEY